MPNSHALRHHSQNKKASFIDRFIYFVAVAYPLSSLPQILKIYGEKNAEAISISTFVLFTVFALIWLIYGIVHKDKAILLSNVLWISTYIIIIIGAILY